MTTQQIIRAVEFAIKRTKDKEFPFMCNSLKDGVRYVLHRDQCSPDNVEPELDYVKNSIGFSRDNYEKFIFEKYPDLVPYLASRLSDAWIHFIDLSRINKEMYTRVKTSKIVFLTELLNQYGNKRI